MRFPMSTKKKSSARKIRLCKGPGCNNQGTTGGFCRLCYLKNWKKIRSEKKKKAAKNLNKYIDNIMKTSKDRGAKSLRENLQSEVTFERSLDDMIHHDSVRTVMTDLGCREDLDIMIDSISIDEDF